MLLKGGKVLNENFVFENKDLYIENGKFSIDGDPHENIDISGLTVIPGLIDMHIHGYAGTDVSASDYRELNLMRKKIAEHGTTSLLAATTTQAEGVILSSVENVRKSIESSDEGAEILGIYLEGPYLSTEYKGAMLIEYIRPLDLEEFDRINEKSGNNIKICTVAPEVNGNVGKIPGLVKRGVIPSVGHSGGVAVDVEKAFEAGASNVTHLFNGMRGLGHREPGVVGAALDSDATCEIICDGHHINEKVIRFAYKILGRERMILISDDIHFAGCPDGKYGEPGNEMIIKDGTCKLPDGTFNGNVNPLMECIRRAVKFGIPFEDAVYCASFGPARKLGVSERLGSIAPGKDADMIILDDDMNIKYVFKKGKMI